MPAGRPRLILDASRVTELASKGYIMRELAAILDVSEDTLHRHYAEAIKTGRELCNSMIRAKQIEVALQGNPTMLIWIGKQNLAQTDRTDIRIVEELGFGDFAEAVVAGADKADATAARVH